MFKLSDFVETEVPIRLWVENGIVCDSLMDEWHFVFLKGDEVLIEQRCRPEEQTEHELQIENGKFTGLDFGEFGGGLNFTPDVATPEEVQKKEPIVHFSCGAWHLDCGYCVFGENIDAIFRFKNRIFALTGMAHLGTDEGALMEIICQDNLYSAKKLADLESAPGLYTICDQNLHILAERKFCIFDTISNSLTTKMDTPELFVNRRSGGIKGLRSTSMVAVDAETVYVGLAGGIMMLNPIRGTTRMFYRKSKQEQKMT